MLIMTAAEQEANDDTHRCDDPLDTDQFTNIMNIYESGHISYDSEEDEDEETSISGHDDTEKDVEALYNNLSIYEFQLDTERFTELEKMLAECDDVIKESDHHLGSLESFKKNISQTFSDSDKDDAEDLDLLEICGAETFQLANYDDQSNNLEDEQLFLTEGPTENGSDENLIGDEITPAIADRISDLTKVLQLQLTETDETYERLLGQQSRRYKEMNDNSDRLDCERKENLAHLEDEKSQCQRVKEAKAAAMCQWEEDHQNQVKEELETQQIHIKKLEELMEKEREKANILSQIQQEEQKKREMKSAIKIQSVVRMFRIRKQYRIVQEKRRKELEKKKQEEREEQAKREEKRKIEEEKEKEKRRLKEEEERIKKEKEEEIKKKEIEKRKREEEEKKAEEEKMEEERKKREEEERKKREEEEKEKREEEEKEKRQEEERKRKEEQEKKKREEEKRMKEEEERRKREEEERIKREEEERRKREQEKLQKEEEERKKKEEEKRVKRENEERRKKEEEEREKREERGRKKKREEEEKIKVEGTGERREEKERKQCEAEESGNDEGKEGKRREEKVGKIEEGVKIKGEEKGKEVERARKEEEKEEEEEEEEEREKTTKEKEKKNRELKEMSESEILQKKEKEEEKEKEMSESEILQKKEKEEEGEKEKEKEMSESEKLQKKEKEVERKLEEEVNVSNKEDIENDRDYKMADLLTEMRQSVNPEIKDNRNKEDEQGVSGYDKNQTIKGVLIHEEREGEREKEKEENTKEGLKKQEVGSEKNGERRKELQTELDNVLSWKMEENRNKNESVEIKKRDPKIIDKVSVTSFPFEDQQEISTGTKTGKVKMTNLQPLRQTLNVKRLAWMENCLPWGKISNQPWIDNNKNRALKKSERKRPPSKKRLPNPISEAVILSATKCNLLTQVTSVHLKNLNGFTLTTLGQCPHLQYLSVNNCQLLTLDGLQGCSQLKYIDVKNNNVEYVNVKDMGNLQVLDLSHNNLALIHGLDECSNLLWLNLQHNRITKLGSSLVSLHRLNTLLLGYNQLVSTSGLQDGGAELQTLDISYNQLQHVTDIGNFCLLRSLDVSGNNLLETPNLTNHVLMQELHLSNNCLSSLIELSQCWLPLLRVLNLEQNRLSSVPPMEYVHSLKIMDIRNNQVLDSVEIVKGLSNCKQLEQLLLEGNPLSEEHTIREQMSKAFPHLRYLDYGCSTSSEPCQREENPPILSYSVSADNGFQQMCASQTEIFDRLEYEFQQKLKSLSESESLDLPGLCNAYVKKCQKSMKIAVECRYAHEYGDTSINELLAVGESMEQERESTSTPTDTETTEIVAKVTSPETYHNPSCQTAEKSQDSRSKGQDSEVHLNRSGHDYSVVAAPGLTPARQEHATTTAAVPEVVSAKHSEICEYRRSSAKPEVPKEDCDQSQTRNQNETARSHNFQRPKESDVLLAKRNKAATRIQAVWRGFYLRVKLHAALEFAQNVYEEESEFGEEIDLTSFDMAEADLEKTWTVSDTPPLPMNFPVLGKPPPSRSLSGHQLRLPKSLDENRLNEDKSPSPAHPRLAWNTPEVSARSIPPINSTLRPRDSDILRNSPPPTSASGTKENDLPALMSRRKDDEICKEWGFKDTRTAQMMRQRAKKMKFNAERREKLKKLDPHQRLALFRKLGEVIPVIPLKSPSRKMLPKKEYFQARQFNMGLNIGYFEMMSKEEETKIKESRTYQWIHTQITPFDNDDQKSQPSLSDKNISISRKKALNPSQRVILFQKPQVTGGAMRGAGTCERSRSAMDSDSEPTRDSRRHSTPGSANRPVYLPPIDRSSISTRHWGGSMSHWNPDVEKSGGWGGGRKRSKRKRSTNVFDGH